MNRLLSVQLHLAEYSYIIQGVYEPCHFAIEKTIRSVRIDRLRHEELAELRNRHIIRGLSAGNECGLSEAIDHGGEDDPPISSSRGGVDAADVAGGGAIGGAVLAVSGVAAGIGEAVARPVIDEIVGDFVAIDLIAADGRAARRAARKSRGGVVEVPVVEAVPSAVAENTGVARKIGVQRQAAGRPFDRKSRRARSPRVVAHQNGRRAAARRLATVEFGRAMLLPVIIWFWKT